MGAVWNPADKDARLVLSNNNKTVARNATTGGSNPIVRGLNPKSTGKWWIEYTITAADLSAKNLGFGLATSAFTTYFGDGATNYGIYTSGSAAYNNSFPPVTSTLAVGDRIAFAVDFSLKKAWISRNDAWLNGDPVAGTSGQTVSGTAAWYPAASPTSANGADTLTMSSVGTPPSGYSAWDGDAGGLTPNGSSQSQAAASPSLASKAATAPDSAAQAHQATSPALGVGVAIAVDPASQSQASTSPTLAARAAVSPDSATQVHTASSPAIAARAAVSPDSASQGHVATSPSVATAGMVAINPASQPQAATQPSVLTAGTVGVAGAAQAQASTSPTLSARSSVVPASASQTHAASIPLLSVRMTILPASAAQSHLATMPSLFAASVVAANDASQGQITNSPNVFIAGGPPPPASRTAVTVRVSRVVFSRRLPRLAA